MTCWWALRACGRLMSRRVCNFRYVRACTQSPVIDFWAMINLMCLNKSCLWVCFSALWINAFSAHWNITTKTRSIRSTAGTLTASFNVSGIVCVHIVFKYVIIGCGLRQPIRVKSTNITEITLNFEHGDIVDAAIFEHIQIKNGNLFCSGSTTLKRFIWHIY